MLNSLVPLAQATRRAVSAATLLFKDTFPQDESNPLASPRTAEIGTGLIVDAAGVMSIASGKMINDGSGSSNTYGSALYKTQELYARTAGMTGVIWCDSGLGYIGFTLNIYPHYAIGATALYSNGYSVWGFLPALSGTNIFAVVLQTTGSLIIRQNDDKVAWVWSNGTNTPLAFGVWQRDKAVTTISGMKTSQLESPYDVDFAFATERLAGARLAGDTFMHEKDALVYFYVTTLPSSGQIEFRFRIQDANSYWQVTVDSSGNLDLDEVVAGTPVQRGASAGVVANGERIMIIFDNEEVRVYEERSTRITYTFAANFKTETSGELESLGTGGAVSDVVSTPRNLSGAALAAINAVANA